MPELGRKAIFEYLLFWINVVPERNYCKTLTKQIMNQ
jgi:hypothetical protein